MRSRTRALSWLALGLGLPGVLGSLGSLGMASDAEAAPSTPPPPKPQAKRATPPPPSTTPGASTGSPFLPTPRAGAGTSPTPPPPSAAPPAEVDDPTRSAEPEPPPQDLSHTWGYSRAQPLQPRYVRTDDPTQAAPNPVGFYSGVSVQGNHVPPFPAKALGATPAVMTWTGFERTPQGSRVFFQLSAEASYEVVAPPPGAKDALTLRIRMRNTKVNVRNNLRYLDLRYFETPVRTVKVTRRGRDTVATLVLQRQAVPDVRIVDGKAGYKLLVVQFSDASDQAGPATPPTPPTQ